MVQPNFKNPLSLVGFFVITIAYLNVNYTSTAAQPQIWPFLLSLVIFLTGIFFLRKMLLMWFSDFTVLVTLMALGFATNIFFIVTLDFRLQPILLFSLYSMALYFTASWHENQKVIFAVLLAIILGLITLLSPTGFIFLLVPVLWNVHDKASWKSKIRLVKNNLRQAGLFICLVIAIGLTPLLIWKVSPGEVPFLSFTLPGIFHGFSSWLWNDLFSFDHGWFIYTPVIIFAFIGFYFIGKHRPIFYAVFLYCFLDIFLESSWSKLGSTPVFGQVAFIPIYALLVIPMASFFSFSEKGSKIRGFLLLFLTAFFIFLNIFQSWQFSKGILMKSGMNAENYCLVFGRTSISEVEKMKIAGHESDTTLVFKDENRFRKTMLVSYDFEDANASYKNQLEKVCVKSGTMSLTMDSTNRYSPGVGMLYDELIKKPCIGLRISASVFVMNSKDFADVNLVITSQHGKITYRYKKLNLGDLKLKPGTWNTLSLDYLIPAAPSPGDRLFAYIWYTGSFRIYVDDIKCETFELKD
jgi:hypothetical protein